MRLSQIPTHHTYEFLVILSTNYKIDTWCLLKNKISPSHSPTLTLQSGNFPRKPSSPERYIESYFIWSVLWKQQSYFSSSKYQVTLFYWMQFSTFTFTSYSFKYWQPPRRSMLRIADFKATLFFWFFPHSKWKMVTMVAMITLELPWLKACWVTFSIYHQSRWWPCKLEIIIPVLQMREVRLREVQWLAQGNTESKWQSEFKSSFVLFHSLNASQPCHRSSLIHRKFLIPLIGLNYGLSKEECAGLSFWHWPHLTGNSRHL